MTPESYNTANSTYTKEQTSVLKVVIALALVIVLSSISMPFLYTHSPAQNYNKACLSKGGTIVTIQPQNETRCVTFVPVDITAEDLQKYVDSH